MPLEAQDEGLLMGLTGKAILIRDDETIAKENSYHEKSGIAHAKKLTLAASPSFGGHTWMCPSKIKKE